MAETLTIRTASSTEVVKISSQGPQGPKGDKGDPGDVAGLPLSAQGDLLYRGASENQRLPIGASGQILKVAGGVPSWANESGSVTSVNDKTGAVALTATDVSAVPTSVFTSTGDMIFRNASGAVARLPLGAQGSLLSVGSQAAPFWASPPITTNVYFIANQTVNGSFIAGVGNNITSYTTPSNRLVQIIVAQSNSGDLTIHLNTTTGLGPPQNGDTVRIDIAAKSGTGSKVIVSTNGFGTFDGYDGHSMYFIYTTNIQPARWVRCVEPYNRSAPSNSGSLGVPGEFAADSRYIYFCTALNQWRRVAIANW